MKPVYQKYNNKKIRYLGQNIKCCCEVFEAWIGVILVYATVPMIGRKTWGIRDSSTNELVVGSFHHCPYCGAKLPDMEEEEGA
jgi:hypothetical protein